MNLRFEVDQAEAFRRGIDCPKSIVTIEVNPSELSEADRHLIADRMEGIDVCQLDSDRTRLRKFDDRSAPLRIVAAEPTYEALLQAVQNNEQSIKPDTVAKQKFKDNLQRQAEDSRRLIQSRQLNE